MFISDFGGNTLRKPETDKKDSIKIASYVLTYWHDLKKYTSQEDLRKFLKVLNRQYKQSTKLKTMMSNNLISLLELTFLWMNKLFPSPVWESDSHENWIDFVLEFPHYDKISKITMKAFAKNCVRGVSAVENCHAIQTEMNRVVSQLLEYSTVVVPLWEIYRFFLLIRNLYSLQKYGSYNVFNDDTNELINKVDIPWDVNTKNDNSASDMSFIFRRTVLTWIQSKWCGQK